MNKPEFITFTGADDHTPVAGMIELSQKYPIEWGILFSPKHQGSGRYPTLTSIQRFVDTAPQLRLSAHICGGHSRELIDTGKLPDLEHIIRAHFARVQINTTDPSITPQAIGYWADRMFARAILQTREHFPDEPSVDWLFDRSGGRGILPDVWPSWNGTDAITGYAGGLRPENVAAAVKKIGVVATRYWIDMETGVRNAKDEFDLHMCRQVCEAVYG